MSHPHHGGNLPMSSKEIWCVFPEINLFSQCCIALLLCVKTQCLSTATKCEFCITLLLTNYLVSTRDLSSLSKLVKEPWGLVHRSYSIKIWANSKRLRSPQTQVYGIAEVSQGLWDLLVWSEIWTSFSEPLLPWHCLYPKTLLSRIICLILLLLLTPDLSPLAYIKSGQRKSYSQ